MSEWKQMPFGECFELHRNNTCARALMGNAGSVQNIHYGDILVKYGAVVDLGKEEVPYLTEDGEKCAPKDYLKDGDIVIADTAEDEIAGKVVEVRGLGDRKATAGLHTVMCRPKDGEMFEPGWLGYWMNSKGYHDQLISMMTGIKVLSLSRANFAKTYIWVPKREEQRRIVSAFNNADRLIANLEKRIAKRKLVKQGMMQQLLTGKVRLPGFTGEWVEKAIGDFADVVTGATPSTECAAYWGGDIRWMSSGELNLKEIHDVEGRITKAGFNAASTHMVPVGCVLIGLAGQGKTRGTAAYNHVELCTNQSIASILPNESYVSRLLYYILDSKYEMLRDISSGGGGRGGLSKETLETVKITMPSSNEEQSAIAGILTDCDAEIATLERKLAKYRQLKSGMMSELLTGNVRLGEGK